MKNKPPDIWHPDLVLLNLQSNLTAEERLNSVCSDKNQHKKC